MNAARMNLPPVSSVMGGIMAKVNESSGLLYFLIFVGIVLAIVLGIKAYRDKRNLSTPDNIKRIQGAQLATLEPLWTGITQTKKGLGSQSVPEDQKLLINTAVMSTRLTGYLGPYSDGVFDEDSATRLALSSGARCLVIEIDRDSGGYEPKLIYRDGWGIKRSLNTGSIEKVARSIAGRAFTASNDSVPPQMAGDPLFVTLYFVSAPDQAKEPREYVRFLGKVARALQPLKDRLVGQTPQGDFRRQALESQLFFQPWSVFSGRIIMLCNADTSAFRRLSSVGLAGELGATDDLDLLVHCRLYSKESPSGLGITSAPTSNVAPSAVITTDNYWLNTPPDRLADAQTQTKKAWTLVMTPRATETNVISAENRKRMYTEFGVHAVPFCLFDAGAGGLVGEFSKSGWSLKPELLRFIPPKPIIVQKPSPQTNANGGAIFSPKV